MSGVSSDFEEYGASYLISEENYERYIAGREEIGRPDGQFVIPSNQMDSLLEEYPDDPREWERQLGLDEGSLGDSNIRRVDVYSPEEYNLREPTEDMSGANDQFLGTGETPGGQNEAVIDQFENPEENSEVGSISTLMTQEEEIQEDNYYDYGIY